MLTAQQARDLVEATESVSEILPAIDALISNSAQNGLLFLDLEVLDAVLGVKLVPILISYGYDVRYESSRNLLKIKWS